jgi:hypothetical protein
VVHESEAPLTVPVDPDFATDMRAPRRAEFDSHMAERVQREEVRGVVVVHEARQAAAGSEAKAVAVAATRLLLPCSGCRGAQEERRRQAELKRKQEEEAVREYRKKLRFSVSVRAWSPAEPETVRVAPSEAGTRRLPMLMCVRAPAPQARPMPNFSEGGFYAQPSSKPLTKPRTPNFASKRLSVRRGGG